MSDLWCREPPLQPQKILVTELNVQECQENPRTCQVSAECGLSHSIVGTLSFASDQRAINSLCCTASKFGLGFFTCCLYFSCPCGAVSPREASGWSRSEDILLPAGAGSVPGCLRMQAIQWACKWPHSLVRIFTWRQQIDLQKHMNLFNSKILRRICKGNVMVQVGY